MARAYLRYAPEDDTRPEPLDPKVIARAIQARFDEIKVWLAPRLPTISDEEVLFALATSVRLGAADGFRVGVFLRDMFKWPVDMDLCCYLRDTCNALAFALKVETREWVVRTGLRFPASGDDAIEWIDNLSDKKMTGKLVSLDPSFAAAIVQPADGLLRAGKPRRVFAEQVTANVTKGERAISKIGPKKAANGE